VWPFFTATAPKSTINMYGRPLNSHASILFSLSSLPLFFKSYHPAPSKTITEPACVGFPPYARTATIEDFKHSVCGGKGLQACFHSLSTVLLFNGTGAVMVYQSSERSDRCPPTKGSPGFRVLGSWISTSLDAGFPRPWKLGFRILGS
jgi:hypothetical protein